jgi:hypothetical protein
MEKQIQLYEHLEWIEIDEICLGLFCFLKSILEPEDTSSAWKLWAMTLQLYALLPTTFDDHRHQKKMMCTIFGIQTQFIPFFI